MTDNGINFAVGIHKLEIRPHENADALEIAIVGGYHAVVPKGQYKTGEFALYIPEAALVPDELLEELGLTGRLAGSGKNRVKAIRLRGVVSQGIVCRPAALGAPKSWDRLREGAEDGADWIGQFLDQDYAGELGIEKWIPKVPGQMRGKIRERGRARILPWIEITNIKKPGERREWEDGEPVIATEKIHGTHCMVTLAKVYETLSKDGEPVASRWTREWEFLVSSKGMGKQGWDLVEEDGNVYWRAARQYGLEMWLRAFVLATNWGNDGPPDRIGLYGEVFGESIQDLHYGFKGSDLGYRAFDLKIESRWVNSGTFTTFTRGISAVYGIDLPLVPMLYSGPYDHDLLTELASGKSRVGGGHLREGLVVRPQAEQRDGSGGRKVAKYISDAYLLRANGTELE